MTRLVLRNIKGYETTFLGYDEIVDGIKTGRIVLKWHITDQGVPVYEYAEEPPELILTRLEGKYNNKCLGRMSREERHKVLHGG